MLNAIRYLQATVAGMSRPCTTPNPNTAHSLLMLIIALLRHLSSHLVTFLHLAASESNFVD